MISVPGAAAARAAAPILLVMLAVTLGLMTLMRMRPVFRSLSRPDLAVLRAGRGGIRCTQAPCSRRGFAAPARAGAAAGRQRFPRVDRALRQPIEPDPLLDAQQMGVHRLRGVL